MFAMKTLFGAALVAASVLPVHAAQPLDSDGELLCSTMQALTEGIGDLRDQGVPQHKVTADARELKEPVRALVLSIIPEVYNAKTFYTPKIMGEITYEICATKYSDAMERQFRSR